MRATMSFALLLPFMILSACEETAPDTSEQAEVRQAFLDWERACQTSQGDLAVSRIASRCFDHYDRLIDYATDGDRRTVLALRPTDRSEIVLMRNRITLQDLDRMDGRALLKHVVDQGWGYDPDDSDWFRLGASRSTATWPRRSCTSRARRQVVSSTSIMKTAHGRSI